MPEDAALGTPLAQAISIMARLRGPGGCPPGDREQTFDTTSSTAHAGETYEVFDAIERRAWPELKDEPGDLLLQVLLLYAQDGGHEAGYFDIAGVAEG